MDRHLLRLWRAHLNRAPDASEKYRPLPSQRRFHESPLQSRILFGGNRSGKTVAGAAEAVWHALGRYPAWYPAEMRSPVPSQGWIVGLDYSMVRDVIEPTLQFFLDDAWVVSWNRNTHVIRLSNGSTIGLKSADSGRRKFQGTSRHWIWLDEECPEAIYRECRARIVDVAGRLWMTLTPLRGEAYLRRFVSEPSASSRVGVFYASTRENARSCGGSIPDDEIETFAEQLSDSEMHCRIEGRFQLLEGRAYPSFDRSLHAAENLEADARRELLWSWDFNVTPLCTLLAQRDGNRLLVFDEVVLDGLHGHTTDEAVRSFLDRYAYRSAQHGAPNSRKRATFTNGISLYGDYSGMARSHRGHGNDYEIIRRALEMSDWPRASVHVRPNPPVRERVQGVERLLTNAEDGPRLLISPRCRHLIEDLEQVCWDAHGQLDKKRDSRRTHSSDALGYLVAECFPLVPFERQENWQPPW